MVSTTVPHRGLITLGLMLAAFMSVLDTTVVNVSMPHMQGTLSASQDQITWVVTCYVLATAVMTPLTGWLTRRLGLRRLALIAVSSFTVASVLCGLAQDMPQIMAFRALQGVAAAPIAPLCQSVLLNINPPERYGRAMATFMMSTIVAPIAGPLVGAWMTESLSWRWCFFINVPAGICSVMLLQLFLPRDATQQARFDFLGFASLAIALASLQLVLDRGPSLDWFDSREICAEAVLVGLGCWVFLVHTMTADRGLFDGRLFRDRNFVSTTIVTFFLNLPTFAGITLLPLLMQGLLGYPVMVSGLVSVPRGLCMLGALLVIGRLDALIDRRLLVGVGLAFCLAGFWRMTGFNLQMSTDSIIWASVVLGIGSGIVYVPLSTLAFMTIDPSLRPEASALVNLARNLSGSMGLALIQALTVFNTQSMHASMVSRITAGALNLRGMSSVLHGTREAVAFNAEITRQANMIAFVDDFQLMVLSCVICMPFLLLLRSPPRNKAAGQGLASAEAIALEGPP
jgi:DHA2 family multidrug resistance protein